MITLVTIIFLIVTFLMAVSILMQSSKSDGLGAGFSALGGTQVFGGRGPADMLKKFTTYTAILYGALTIFLAYLHSTNQSEIGENPFTNTSTAPAESSSAADQLAEPDLAEPTKLDSTK